jgi:hypothetical protein
LIEGSIEPRRIETMSGRRRLALGLLLVPVVLVNVALLAGDRLSVSTRSWLLASAGVFGVAGIIGVLAWSRRQDWR